VQTQDFVGIAVVPYRLFIPVVSTHIKGDFFLGGGEAEPEVKMQSMPNITSVLAWCPINVVGQIAYTRLSIAQCS
jgi:hypothetical protein